MYVNLYWEPLSYFHNHFKWNVMLYHFLFKTLQGLFQLKAEVHSVLSNTLQNLVPITSLTSFLVAWLLILLGHMSLLSIHLISHTPSNLSLLPGPLVPQKSMCLPRSFSRPGLYFIQKEHVAFLKKNWGTVDLQCCISFCCVAKQFFFSPDSFPL